MTRLKAEKNLYEENMKKAFMRGVCALNLEAMTMFQHHEDESGDQKHNHTCTAEGQPVSIPLHVHAGSKPDTTTLSSHRGVPNSHQSRSGSKSAHDNGIQLSRAKLHVGQAGSSKNNIQGTNRRIPVVVEKH